MSGADDRRALELAYGYPYPRHDRAVRFGPADGGYRAVRLAGIAESGTFRPDGYRRAVATWEVVIADVAVEERLPDRVAVIATGSNASPEQLARKWTGLLDDRPVIVAPVDVAGATSVYSAHVARYGAIPATLHPTQGVTSRLHLLFVPASEMALLDASESLGQNYVLAALDDLVAVTQAGPVAAPLGYVSLRGAVLDEGRPVALAAGRPEGHDGPVRDEREMLDWVRRLVGDRRDLDAFVLALGRDETFRRQVVARLAERGSVWDLPDAAIVAGGPA